MVFVTVLNKKAWRSKLSHVWNRHHLGMNKEKKILQIKTFHYILFHFLTMVGLPLLMSCPTSWKMLLQLILLSTVPLFTMTATASRICSRTYFWRLEKMCRINTFSKNIPEDMNQTLGIGRVEKREQKGDVEMLCIHSCSLLSLACFPRKRWLHCNFQCSV